MFLQDLGDLSLKLLPQHNTGNMKGQGAGRGAWSHFNISLAKFQLADLPGIMARHFFSIAIHCPLELRPGLLIFVFSCFKRGVSLCLEVEMSFSL